MNSKDIELIKEMLQMQAKLDEAIMKEYGLKELDEEKLNLAILDEIQELIYFNAKDNGFTYQMPQDEDVEV